MSKICSIGSVPNDFIDLKLKDLADTKVMNSFTDGDWIESKHMSCSGVRLIQTGNIGVGKFIEKDNKKYISEKTFNELKCKEVKEGDILICRLADPIGRSCIIPKINSKLITSVDVALLRINKKYFDNKYINYYFNFEKHLNTINSFASGTTRQRISRGNLGEVKVAVPPLKEQQKIAEILSSVDATIEKTEQVIAKTEEVKKGLMQQLLTKGIGHTEFKQTEIGEIPVEWGVKNFKDISKVNQGLQIAISARFKDPGINRKIYITIQYLNDKSNKENIYYVENPNANVVCTEEDILMTRTGNTGYVVTGVKGVFHNNFFKVDYDRSKLNRNFLVLYLKSDKIQNKIMTYAGATTIPDLNHGDFYRIPVVIPPIEEQIKIATIIESVQNKINEEYNTLNGLKNIKQGLMQQLLTGQTRVKID